MEVVRERAVVMGVGVGHRGSTGWIPVKYRLDTRKVQAGYQGSTGMIPGKYRLDTSEVQAGYQ